MTLCFSSTILGGIPLFLGLESADDGMEGNGRPRVLLLVTGSLTSATFKNCVFHDNFGDGICGGGATIHLHGEHLVSLTTTLVAL